MRWFTTWLYVIQRVSLSLIYNSSALKFNCLASVSDSRSSCDIVFQWRQIILRGFAPWRNFFCFFRNNETEKERAGRLSGREWLRFNPICFLHF
jgi:hypothetical protein